MSSLQRTTPPRRMSKVQYRQHAELARCPSYFSPPRSLPYSNAPTTPPAMDDEEQRIEACKSSLTQIGTMLRSTPRAWRNYVALARTVTAHLDATTFMQRPGIAHEQARFITGLQAFAFVDQSSDALPDLVAWCARQWLSIIQREPANIAALRGIGQLWLSRAQPSLSRIHRSDRTPTTATNGSHTPRRPRSGGSDSNGSSRSSGEAEQRTGTADFVEARGYLQPAVDYFERAISASAAQRASCGDLLSTTAEAYLSLGHASSPRTNEPYFRRAVQILQIASTIPGFTLSRYLQRYLDDYGRLLD